MAGHVERAADRERALTHVVKPVTGRAGRRVESDPVVGDLQNDGGIFRAQPHLRAAELRFRVLRLLADAIGDILEEQTDAIKRLHHTVVEVHADAKALLFDGHALGLFVQPRVLDRDRGLRGERLERFGVGLTEFDRIDLLGEVQITERLSAEDDRGPKETLHRWMVLRKADGGRMRVEVLEAKGFALGLEVTEEPESTREVPDERALLLD